MKHHEPYHIIQTILEELENVPNRKVDGFVGIDGYIDKIQQVVQKKDQEERQFYPTIAQLGDRIKQAAGLSSQFELVTHTVKLGGNAPIMANALGQLEIANTCLGTFGFPSNEPIFRTISTNCQLISVGKAAESNALEFNDGKLILSELSTFENLNWNKILEVGRVDAIQASLQKAELIALVGWCNLPHATNLWKGILELVAKIDYVSPPHFFFDLADPSGKTDESIENVLQLIASFGAIGKTTLGINENEAIQLHQILCRLNGKQLPFENLEQTGKFLFAELNLHQLLIHPVASCYLFNKRKTYHLEGKVIQHPKVSTGGGDNFNAGFCFGLLNGFTEEQSMILAMATSGAYVQAGKSPTVNDIKEYIEIWQKELNKL